MGDNELSVLDIFNLMKSFVSIEDNQCDLSRSQSDNFLGYKFNNQGKYYAFYLTVVDDQVVFTYRKDLSKLEQYRIALSSSRVDIVKSIIKGIITRDIDLVERAGSGLARFKRRNTDKVAVQKKVVAKRAKTAQKFQIATVLGRAVIVPFSPGELSTDSWMVSSNTDDDVTAFSNEIGELVYSHCSSTAFKISDRDLVILLKRLGLISSRSHTLESIGREYGITRERVRQIVDKKIRKLEKIGLREKIQLLLSGLPNDKRGVYLYEGVIDPYGRPLFDYVLGMTKNRKELVREVSDYGLYLRAKMIDESKRQRRQEVERIRRENDFRFIESLEKTPIMNLADGLRGFDLLNKERVVNVENNSGIFKSRKSGDVLEWESSIERKVLVMLEKNHLVKQIKTQSFKVPYNYSVSGYYYPDVQILTVDNEIYIIEVKPLWDMIVQENIDKYEALRTDCATMGYGYVMIDERNNTFESLLRHEVDPVKREKIEKELKSIGMLQYHEFRRLSDSYGVTIKDFLRVIYDNRRQVRYSSRPLRVEYKP